MTTKISGILGSRRKDIKVNGYMMNKIESFDRFEKIIMGLGNQILHCQKAINLIIKLKTLSNNQAKIIDEFNYLFGHLFTLSVNYILQKFSNIIIDNKDSISVHYLLRFFEANIKLYVPKNQITEIHDSLSELTEHFSPESEARKTLTTIRDKSLAHFDKNHLNPEAQKTWSIPIKKLQTEIEFCRKKLQDLCYYFGFDQDFFDYPTNYNIDKELEYLEMLVSRSDNQS